MKKVLLINNESVSSLILENVRSWDDPRIDPEWIIQILKCRDTSGFTPTDEDVLKHLRGDVLTLCFKNNNLVGFNSVEYKSPYEIWNGLIKNHKFISETGVYFAGAFIDGAVQKSGFYQQMTKHRILRGIEKGLKIIFTETQNPNIEVGIKKTLESMMSNAEITDYTMDDRIFFAGLYGRCMYKEIPKNSKVSFNELNYSNGDAYGLVFHINIDNRHK